MRGHYPFLILSAVALGAAALVVGSAPGGFPRLAANISGVFAGNSSSSATSTSAGTNNATYSLTDVLQELQNQDQLLTEQLSALRGQVESLKMQAVFTRPLKRGDSGEDVSQLQDILVKLGFAASSTFTAASAGASTASGFYGPLTVAAVKDFQSGQGLKATGAFDKAVRDKLLEADRNLVINDGALPPDFSPIDLSSVPDLQNSMNASAPADLQDQLSALAASSSADEADIADLENQISQVNTALSAVESSVSANISPAGPLPLSISNLRVTNIAKTSATVVWTTNNSATAEVDYSTNSSLPSGTKSVISNSYVTSQSIGLVNLNSGTIYYYRVISKDSSGSLASSPVLSFTTVHS